MGDHLRAATHDPPLANDQERSAYGHAVNLLTDAGKSRQQLLFFTQPEIPTALWVVIYLGVFLMVLLVAVHYADHPEGRVVALATITVLLTVVVAVLSMLDRPFGPGVRVQPDPMRQAIAILSAGHVGGASQQCPATPRNTADRRVATIPSRT